MNPVSLWKHVPLLASTERLRAAQPLGAGALQQLAANGTAAVRENSLRTLWNGACGEVWRDLDVPGDVSTFPWDRDSDGVVVIPALRFRVRRFGEKDAWPVLLAKLRCRTPSGTTLGVLLHVAPSVGYPNLAQGLHASETTTSTTLTTLEVELPLEASALGRYAVDEDTPAPTGEHGTVDELVAYVGVWCSSGASATKGLAGALSLYLAQP